MDGRRDKRSAPVHLDIARIVRELALVLSRQIESSGDSRQQAIEKLDVTRMMVVIELVVARVDE